MDILINDKELSGLMNDPQEGELSKEELDQLAREKLGIGAAGDAVRQVNIGQGADWLVLLVSIKTMVDCIGDLLQVAEIISKFGGVIDKIKGYFQAKQLLSIDADGAKLLAMDYLIHNFDCNSLRLLSCTQIPNDLPITESPSRYYLLTYQVNDNDTVVLGIKATGEIEIVRAFSLGLWGEVEEIPEAGLSDGIAITYGYNGREIDGIEQFQQELEQAYYCQGKDKWLPACSEGGEVWLNIIFNATIWGFLGAVGYDIVKDLLKDVIVAGGKKFLLTPLKKAISNLRKKNADTWGLKVVKTTFSFNDVEVIIGGLSDEEFDKLGAIFKQIYDAKKILTKEHGDVVRIEIPAYYLYGSKSWELDEWRSDEELLDGALWIITYWDEGKALYNSKTGEMLDYYTFVPKDGELLV